MCAHIHMPAHARTYTPVRVCVYICIYVYICRCIHMVYVCMPVCISTKHIQKYTHAHICVYIQLAYIHIYIYVYRYAYAYVYMYIPKQICICTCCVYTYMKLHIHIQNGDMQWCTMFFSPAALQPICYMPRSIQDGSWKHSRAFYWSWRGHPHSSVNRRCWHALECGLMPCVYKHGALHQS